MINQKRLINLFIFIFVCNINTHAFSEQKSINNEHNIFVKIKNKFPSMGTVSTFLIMFFTVQFLRKSTFKNNVQKDIKDNVSGEDTEQKDVCQVKNNIKLENNNLDLNGDIYKSFYHTIVNEVNPNFDNEKVLDSVSKLIENLIVQNDFIFVKDIEDIQTIFKDNKIPIESIKNTVENYKSDIYSYKNFLEKCVLAEVMLHCPQNILSEEKYIRNISESVFDAPAISKIPLLLFYMFDLNRCPDSMSYSIAFEMLESVVQSEYVKLRDDLGLDLLDETKKTLELKLQQISYYDSNRKQKRSNVRKRIDKEIEKIINVKNQIADRWCDYFLPVLWSMNGIISIDINKFALVMRVFFNEKFEGNQGRLSSHPFKESLWHLFSKKFIFLLKDNTNNKPYIDFLLNYLYPLYNYKKNWENKREEFVEVYYLDLDRYYESKISQLIEAKKEKFFAFREPVKHDKNNNNNTKKINDVLDWLKTFDYHLQQTEIYTDDIKKLFFLDYDQAVRHLGKTLWYYLISKNGEFKLVSSQILNVLPLCKQQEVIGYFLYFFIRNLDLYIENMNKKQELVNIQNDFDKKIECVRSLLGQFSYYSLNYLLLNIDLKSALKNMKDCRAYPPFLFKEVDEKYDNGINLVLEKTKDFLNVLLAGRSDEQLFDDIIIPFDKECGVDFTKSHMAENVIFLKQDCKVLILIDTLLQELRTYEHSDASMLKTKEALECLKLELENNNSQPYIESPYQPKEHGQFLYQAYRNFLLFAPFSTYFETIIKKVITCDNLNGLEKSKLLQLCFFNKNIVKNVFSFQVKHNQQTCLFLDQFICGDNCITEIDNPVIYKTICLINALIRCDSTLIKELSQDDFDKEINNVQKEPKGFIYYYYPMTQIIKNKLLTSDYGYFPDYNYSRDCTRIPSDCECNSLTSFQQSNFSNLVNEISLRNKCINFKCMKYNMMLFGNFKNSQSPENVLDEIVYSNTITDDEKIYLIGLTFLKEPLKKYLLYNKTVSSSYVSLIKNMRSANNEIGQDFLVDSYKVLNNSDDTLFLPNFKKIYFSLQNKSKYNIVDEINNRIDNIMYGNTELKKLEDQEKEKFVTYIDVVSNFQERIKLLN